MDSKIFWLSWIWFLHTLGARVALGLLNLLRSFMASRNTLLNTSKLSITLSSLLFLTISLIFWLVSDCCLCNNEDSDLNTNSINECLEKLGRVCFILEHDSWSLNWNSFQNLASVPSCHKTRIIEVKIFTFWGCPLECKSLLLTTQRTPGQQYAFWSLVSSFESSGVCS